MPQIVRPAPDLTTADIVNFWSRVRRGDGCWTWRGQRTPRGYGRMLLGTRRHGTLRRVYAHRLALFLTTGLWLEQACHDCDTPGCVRPGAGHANWGTHRKNIDDMVARGRSTWGVRNPHARLNPAKVVAIREAVAAAPPGVAIKRQLAHEHGVTVTTIYDIIARRIWTRVA